MIEEIVVDLHEARPRVLLKIHWSGGAHTTLEVQKNHSGRHGRCTDRAVVDLVAELVKVCDDQAITSILNRLGAGNGWTESRVRSLRSTHRIPPLDRGNERSWLTLREAARHFGISEASVRRLLQQEVLPGKQVVSGAPWVLERENLDLPQVRRAVEAIKAGRSAPSRDPGQGELPLFSIT